MTTINFGISEICTSFNHQVVGTKVLDPRNFLAACQRTLEAYDVSGDKVPGQHLITLSPETFAWVRCGVGRRTKLENDYRLKMFRGRVEAYLHPKLAAECKSVSVVIYTLEAYKKNPEANEKEIKYFESFGATHIIVAVLASAGETSPYAPWTFLKNLAGANAEAAIWTAEEIKNKSQDIVKYWDEWCVVSD